MTKLNLSQKDITHGNYNCLDVIYTREAGLTMDKLIQAKGGKFAELHDYQQSKLNKYLLKIMNRGVRVDLEKKEKLKVQLTSLMGEVEHSLAYLLGEPFNPRSHIQMKAVLGDLLGVNLIKDKKTKKESCSSQYMFAYLKQYPEYRPLLTLILEYRSLGVFLKTFVSAKVDDDGRLRTTFNCAGTKTGRLSSKKTAFGMGANLENIPEKGKIPLKYALAKIEGEEGEDDEDEELSLAVDEELEGINKLPNCKEFFIPDEDFIFWNADYSGADAMIVAWDSDCAWLKNFFKTREEKLYLYLASHYLQQELAWDSEGKPVCEVGKRWYPIFKKWTHATHYKMKDDNAGIGQDLNTKLRNWYFGKCPEIPDWHSKIEDKCKTKGYVENIFGREMWFLNKDTPTRLNQAIASIPQSTIADLTNHGLVNIEENYKDMFFGTINNEEEIKKYFKEDKSSAHCLLQVHDALAGQYHKDDLNALDIIRKSMLIELPYPDKLIVPVDIKTSPISYGDCH